MVIWGYVVHAQKGSLIPHWVCPVKHSLRSNQGASPLDPLWVLVQSYVSGRFELSEDQLSEGQVVSYTSRVLAFGDEL